MTKLKPKRITKTVRIEEGLMEKARKANLDLNEMLEDLIRDCLETKRVK